MKASLTEFELVEIENLKGYNFGETWNGFSVPWFTKQQLKKVISECSNGMDCHMYFRNLKERNREILVVNLEGEIIEIEPEIIDTVNGKQTAYSFIELGWVFTLA